MQTYTALEQSSQKRSYKKPTIAVGTLIIIFGFILKDFPLVIMGAVLVYVMLYKKKVVVDENGVTTYYDGLFYKKTTTYSFSEYDAIRKTVSYGPETNLGFVRKGMTYFSLFKNEDAEAVIELATNINPKIVVQKVEPKRRRA